MSKFKVGDRLKQIEHVVDGQNPYVTVIEVDGDTIVHQHDGETDKKLRCSDTCFELVSGAEATSEFKVGDRVRVDNDLYCGKEPQSGTGIITSINKTNTRPVEVDLDEYPGGLSYVFDELTKISDVGVDSTIEFRNGNTLNGKVYGKDVEVEKMEEPKTTLEKNACKKAKEDAIKEITEEKWIRKSKTGRDGICSLSVLLKVEKRNY